MNGTLIAFAILKCPVDMSQKLSSGRMYFHMNNIELFAL